MSLAAEGLDGDVRQRNVGDSGGSLRIRDEHRSLGQINLLLFHRSKLLIYAETRFGDDPDHVPQVRGGVLLDFGLLRRSHVVRPEQSFAAGSRLFSTPSSLANPA